MTDQPVSLQPSYAGQIPLHPIPAEAPKPRDIVKVIFTDFPSAGNECVFVEVENDLGKSIDAGRWQRRADGLVELVIASSDRVHIAPFLSVLSSTVFCVGCWMLTAALALRYL